MHARERSEWGNLKLSKIVAGDLPIVAKQTSFTVDSGAGSLINASTEY